MKINVKDLEGIANEGIVDLKRDFKIKLSNAKSSYWKERFNGK